MKISKVDWSNIYRENKYKLICIFYDNLEKKNYSLFISSLLYLCLTDSRRSMIRNITTRVFCLYIYQSKRWDFTNFLSVAVRIRILSNVGENRKIEFKNFFRFKYKNTQDIYSNWSQIRINVIILPFFISIRFANVFFLLVRKIDFGFIFSHFKLKSFFFFFDYSFEW